METTFFIPFIFLGILYIAGIVFSICMLIDCLKRDPQFKPTFTSTGEYDKIIWVILIVAGFAFFHLGAIIYFFIVKKSSPGSLASPRIVCTKCQTPVREDWKACPYCGKTIPKV